MTLAAAWAMLPGLEARRRDPEREALALRAAATWAAQFSPNIAIEDLSGIVLEVSGSLRLFRGRDRILAGLEQGMAALGLAACIASGPTARGAWWLARAGRPGHHDTPAALRAALERLPITALDLDARTYAMLEAIGMHAIGDVLALPRAGFARRFGPALLDALDEAVGRRPESRELFVPPEHFLGQLELPAVVEDAGALVFAFRRLFVELEGFLRARNGAAQRLELVFRHEDVPDTHLSLGLVEPAHDAAHFTLLARERFTRLELAAPVRAIALAARDLVTFEQANLVLFEDAVESSSRAVDWARLVERLRARLGGAAVHGIGMVAEHRPEYVVTRVEPGSRIPAAETAPTFGRRPLWLLARPEPLGEVEARPWMRRSATTVEGPLLLLAGPERIESGWWDGGDVTRDYFVAQTPDHALVWVYRDRRPPGGWFLHGLFA